MVSVLFMFLLSVSLSDKKQQQKTLKGEVLQSLGLLCLHPCMHIEAPPLYRVQQKYITRFLTATNPPLPTSTEILRSPRGPAEACRCIATESFCFRDQSGHIV